MKFHVFREAIKKYASWEIPEIPKPIPMRTIDKFRLKPVMSLYENIDWSNPTAVS
jgi:hypothetical protein